jgi:hypothetical protein
MDPDTRSAPHLCDGSYDSFCGGKEEDCLLYGANDHRGGIFDSYSGWLIVNLAKLKHGLVAIRVFLAQDLLCARGRKGGHVKQSAIPQDDVSRAFSSFKLDGGTEYTKWQTTHDQSPP